MLERCNRVYKLQAVRYTQIIASYSSTKLIVPQGPYKTYDNEMDPEAEDAELEDFSPPKPPPPPRPAYGYGPQQVQSVSYPLETASPDLYLLYVCTVRMYSYSADYQYGRVPDARHGAGVWRAGHEVRLDT